MFGHRSDGHLVKKIDPIVALTPYIMPTRCDAQIFAEYKVDFEKLARYIAAKSNEGYKITFMEILIAAYVRTVSQLPEINRFIANKRLYARKELAVSFAMIRNSADGNLAENTTKCYFDLSDTIFDVADRVQEAVERCRVENADNSTLKVAQILRRPLLANPIVWLARLLDRYGLMPRWLINASPFHTSMFITNMASIGLPAIQHHIYNFGTCSQFLSLGSVERTVALDSKGNVVRKRMMPIGIVADERICQGAMYARMLAMMNKLVSDPAQLEKKPEKVFYDEEHEYHLPQPKRAIFNKKKENAVQA